MRSIWKCCGKRRVVCWSVKNLRRRYERTGEPQVVVKQQELNPINMCMPRSFLKFIKRCCFLCDLQKHKHRQTLWNKFFSNLIPKLEPDSNNLIKNMNSSQMYSEHFVIVNLLSHFITLIKNANFVCYCICSGYRINIEADNPRSCKWILKSIFWMKNCAIWRKLLSIHILFGMFS